MICVARRLPRDEHLRAVALPGQRHIARRRPPVLGVIEIRPVQGLPLPLVDRPRIAVPEALELGGGPGHLPPSPAGGVQPRGDLAGQAIEAGDGAGVAVVDVPPLVGVGELHPVADRERRLPVLRVELDIGAGQRAAGAVHFP